MDHEHEPTVSARPMPPNDSFDKEKKQSSDSHPIFKLILAGLAFIAFLLLLKIVKA
jgi:hypothetical protein